MRQKVDVVELKSIANGYEFTLQGQEFRLRFEDGAWRLLAPRQPDLSALFESLNEAMNFALESGELDS